jgi:hypothetical protein
MAPWPPGHPSWVMKGLGIRTALPRGRAERVRPRKPPIASSPGSRRKAISPRMVHPAEGRAPHARKGRPPPHRGISPLGPPVRLRIGAEPNALASVRPCQADAQSASLRENRPSRDPRAFLRKAIPPWLAPRRGGLRTPANDLPHPLTPPRGALIMGPNFHQGKPKESQGEPYDGDR